MEEIIAGLSEFLLLMLVFFGGAYSMAGVVVIVKKLWSSR